MANTDTVKPLERYKDIAEADSHRRLPCGTYWTLPAVGGLQCQRPEELGKEVEEMESPFLCLLYPLSIFFVVGEMRPSGTLKENHEVEDTTLSDHTSSTPCFDASRCPALTISIPEWVFRPNVVQHGSTAFPSTTTVHCCSRIPLDTWHDTSLLKRLGSRVRRTILRRSINNTKNPQSVRLKQMTSQQTGGHPSVTNRTEFLGRPKSDKMKTFEELTSIPVSTPHRSLVTSQADVEASHNDYIAVSRSNSISQPYNPSVATTFRGNKGVLNPISALPDLPKMHTLIDFSSPDSLIKSALSTPTQSLLSKSKILTETHTSRLLQETTPANMAMGSQISSISQPSSLTDDAEAWDSVQTESFLSSKMPHETSTDKSQSTQNHSDHRGNERTAADVAELKITPTSASQSTTNTLGVSAESSLPTDTTPLVSTHVTHQVTAITNSTYFTSPGVMGNSLAPIVKVSTLTSTTHSERGHTEQLSSWDILSSSKGWVYDSKTNYSVTVLGQRPPIKTAEKANGWVDIFYRTPSTTESIFLASLPLPPPSAEHLLAFDCGLFDRPGLVEASLRPGPGRSAAITVKTPASFDLHLAPEQCTGELRVAVVTRCREARGAIVAHAGDIKSGTDAGRTLAHVTLLPGQEAVQFDCSRLAKAAAPLDICFSFLSAPGTLPPLEKARRCLPTASTHVSIQSLGKWGPWGKCSESCGIGIRRREWLCSHGNPSRPCSGVLADKVTPCLMSDCPQATLHTTTAETTNDGPAPPQTSGLAGGMTAFGMVLCSIIIVATLAFVLHARLRHPITMAPVSVAMQEVNQSQRHLVPPSFGYALAQEQLRRLRREGRDAGTTTYMVLRHSVGEQAVWAFDGLLPMEPLQAERELPSAYGTQRRATWSGPRQMRPSSEVRFQQQGKIHCVEEHSTESSSPTEDRNMQSLGKWGPWGKVCATNSR
uniref:thrombospondin type-1 domain-containing protein 1 n=1 Tax=Myxine glutinosa TaxID=7769 RepID=UPI00358FF178